MRADYKDFKRQLDGLWPDVLASYGIEIPKMRGLNSVNHPCPLCGGDDRAHWREVDGRLCLFCRNCAADSMKPPETVIMEYCNIDFPDLVRELADYVNHVPIERVERARNRVRAPKFNLPPDDKRDTEKSLRMLSKCSKRELAGCDIYEYDGMQFLAVTTFNGDIVNVCELGRDNRLLAGGVSYGAFTMIRKNDSNNFIACAIPWDARRISEKYQVNTLICYTDHNIKYVVRNKPDDWKVKPALTDADIHAHCLFDEAPYFLYRGGDLVKCELGELTWE